MSSTSAPALDAPKRRLPGPPLRPWQAIRYLRNPYSTLREYAARYGRLFRVQTFRHCAITGDPELVRQIIAAPVDQYGVNYEPGPARVFGARSMPMLAGRPLRRERHIIVPPFHGSAVAATGSMIRDVTLATFGAYSPGQTFVVRVVAADFSRDVILRTIFGADAGSTLDDFRQAAKEFAQSFDYIAFLWLAAFHFDLDWLPPNRRLARTRRRLEELLQTAIEASRAGTLPETAILNRIVAARYDDGTPMDDEAIRDNMVTTLFAGHKVTVASLAWAFHWLHRHPESLNALTDELAPLGPDADPAAWAGLPYLDAVVKEVLRMFPRASEIYRLLAKPMELGGYELPAGMDLAAAPAILHYDPDLFPEPDAFRPERFLKRRFAPHEFIPFGGGERMCPGGHLSAYVLKVALATIFTRWRYTLSDTGPLEVRRIAGMMAPANGIPVRLEGPR